jgi:UDP-glucose 4-epimerase
MKLAITGALGHIGSAFIRTLGAGQFEEVLLVDNLSGERYSSLFNLPDDVPFQFAHEDIRTADLATLLAGYDVVIHLAAITNAAESFAIADLVQEVNFAGTCRVAEACLKNGAQLLFLSTTSLYGTQKDVVDEDCPSEDLKPQSPYASSKLQAEEVLKEYGNKGLDFVTVRFGTVFGTSIGMRFHTAINKFCWQASTGKPITVWRTALQQKRPYLHVSDAVRALHFMLSWSRFDRRTYNVVTTNAAVSDILGIIRSEIPAMQVELVDSAIMNQLSYTVLANRFQDRGFAFEGNLESGVRDTLALLKVLRPRLALSR